jgi:hypothetical protein
VGELVRVENRPHGDDDAVRDLERSDPESPSLLVVEDQAGLAVGAGWPVRESLSSWTTPSASATDPSIR